jgi:hypothetical protein
MVNVDFEWDRCGTETRPLINITSQIKAPLSFFLSFSLSIEQKIISNSSIKSFLQDFFFVPIHNPTPTINQVTTTTTRRYPLEVGVFGSRRILPTVENVDI